MKAHRLGNRSFCCPSSGQQISQGIIHTRGYHSSACIAACPPPPNTMVQIDALRDDVQASRRTGLSRCAVALEALGMFPRMDSSSTKATALNRTRRNLSNACIAACRKRLGGGRLKRFWPRRKHAVDKWQALEMSPRVDSSSRGLNLTERHSLALICTRGNRSNASIAAWREGWRHEEGEGGSEGVGGGEGERGERGGGRGRGRGRGRVGVGGEREGEGKGEGGGGGSVRRPRHSSAPADTSPTPALPPPTPRKSFR